MKIIAQAPTRISLFGGGTDLPVYYEKYGGMVINFAINLRTRLEINNGDWDFGVPNFGSEEFYNAFFKEFDFKYESFKGSAEGIIESGLGSSATAAVAMVGAIAKAKGIPFTRREIAEKAWDIEVNKLGLYGGKQDQYIATFGGIKNIYFQFNGEVYLNEMDTKTESFIKDHLLLFYTGENRKDKKIQDNLKELTTKQIFNLHDIKSITKMARNALVRYDPIGIGTLLGQAWNVKKEVNNLVSNDKIDLIYNTGIKMGALGGKLMGSGGGGFIFFWVRSDKHESVIKSLADLKCKYWDYLIDKNGLEVRSL